VTRGGNDAEAKQEGDALETTAWLISKAEMGKAGKAGKAGLFERTCE